MALRHAAVIRITSGLDSRPRRHSITRLEVIDVPPVLRLAVTHSATMMSLPPRVRVLAAVLGLRHYATTWAV